MNTKHTPGPWIIATLKGRTDPYAPVTFSIAHTGFAKAETEANARLIAAAPDLLALLNELQAAAGDVYAECEAAGEAHNKGGEEYGTFKRMRETTDAAHAAIARATGDA